MSETSQKKCTELVILEGADSQVRLSRLQQLVAEAQKTHEKLAVLASGEIFSIQDTAVHQTVFQQDETLKTQGVRLLRLAPGCVCCSSRLILQTHLSRLMRLNQPDWLVLELDSQSHSEQALAVVKSEQWAAWFTSVSRISAVK